MLSRPADEKDWVQAVPFLVEAITVSPTCTLVDVCIQSVLAHLMAVATRGGAYVVNEKYLVVYDLYDLWYAPSAKTMSEQLVLNIAPDKPGSVLCALRFLVEQKAVHGARDLIVGDLLVADQAKYGRVLEKCGFKKFNSLYAA